jgi:hypothetical protein
MTGMILTWDVRLRRPSAWPSYGSVAMTAWGPRYTAYYRDIKDRECSAGTFASNREADRA